MGYGDYVPVPNSVVIKNISLLVGQSKYYQDYDSSLTPNTPSSDGFFYPLVDGVISNQNIKDPVVKISMNEGDSFNLWTVPNNGTPDNYANLVPIKHEYDHQPDLQNTKFSRIFVKDISGNPVKGSV